MRRHHPERRKATTETAQIVESQFRDSIASKTAPERWSPQAGGWLGRVLQLGSTFGRLGKMRGLDFLWLLRLSWAYPIWFSCLARCSNTGPFVCYTEFERADPPVVCVPGIMPGLMSSDGLSPRRMRRQKSWPYFRRIAFWPARCIATACLFFPFNYRLHTETLVSPYNYEEPLRKKMTMLAD
jgi:hypothetical protein